MSKTDVISNDMFKVMSFNIRCRDDADGNSVKERSARLKEITLPLNADIIGLQECRPLWEPYINDLYAGEYDMINIYRAKSELESSPVLWKRDKYCCLGVSHFWLSDTPEVESRGWDERYNCYRMCVHVRLCERETGRVINFLNTHFGFGDNGQIKSAGLIKSYCDRISGEPICIVGDFNMTPESKGYAKMTEYFTDANAVTAKDWRITYHGYSYDNPEAAHIDYCFVNDKVVARAQRIIDETVKGKFPSDHFGLITDLSFL